MGDVSVPARRLSWNFDLTARLKPRHSSCLCQYQEPCESRKISRFSRWRRFLSCRLPCAAADSGRLASIFNLTGRLAPRYSRCSHLDQAPCESCGISRFFSAATIFGLAVSLVAPVAAADASCLAWISHLAGRQAPRRPSSADRHQAPCKSRGISRFSRRRRFFSAATIFGLSRRPCRRR